MDVAKRDDEVLAVFPVEHDDEIVLVSNEGQVIRCPVDDIRIAGRRTQGVTVFRAGETERVVSIASMKDPADAAGAEEGDDPAGVDEAAAIDAAAPDATEGETPPA